jgi:hypothetical protein
MPTIRVDDEVYAALQRQHPAGRTVNTVLRDLLGLTGPPIPAQTRRFNHALSDLLRAGLLQPGQRLTWTRRQLGQIHAVTVNADGALVAEDGSVYASPNSAATGIAGYPTIGWPLWRTDTDVSLEQLLEQLTDTSTGTAHVPRPRAGANAALAPLLRAGLLQPGQRLTWTRPRLGAIHAVTVDEHGYLIAEDGAVHRTPNTAASAISGHPMIGWPVWCTDDGTSVGLLRTRLPTTDPAPDSVASANNR